MLKLDWETSFKVTPEFERALKKSMLGKKIMYALDYKGDVVFGSIYVEEPKDALLFWGEVLSYPKYFYDKVEVSNLRQYLDPEDRDYRVLACRRGYIGIEFIIKANDI